MPFLHLPRPSKLAPNVKTTHGLQFPVVFAAGSTPNIPSASARSSTPVYKSNIDSDPGFRSGSNSGAFPNPSSKAEAIEEDIEKAVYRCRFMTLLGVLGSLIGSFLCFIKGCTYVFQSFVEYFVNHGKVILLLVEAIDVYLLGTVMLVFGMGLYELFVSNLDTSKLLSEEKAPHVSNLFGLFTLKERPKWLDIKTVNELKTKLGHVIVMLLLIGLFDKSKKAAINSPVDLLCFSASILLSSVGLFLLSKLND
ncbi:hypothetical protein FNV43_RR09972 [Rhamnella rubrinervis]|uniref:Uncharacterized protein n=1 Tax=Rhamnella rubrinervis TaxID=2594499 RepID=A0A8K0HBQ3_9ROSA|nr:hypothetical protein FNV43_RR09972 [Rhamnella rubrinervis]